METTSSLQLSRSLPEEQGISSAAISSFIDAVETQSLGLHSFMLLRHGYVVSEGWWSPYKSDLPHMLFSLSKSFTSTAIGFAVTEKLITLDDAVISFFPEEAPATITDNLSNMTIRHLLMMGTGHVVDTMDTLHKSADGNWVKAFFSVPVEKQPGTHFLYNTGATYMLSAILQRVTGQTLLEYLEPRLFAPLGIHGATWQSCPRGINTGGFGLSITTEDIAKFGQLYLQKGIWNSQRILPEQWINEATSKHISNGEGDHDWALGYGYQFWRCQHGAYRADGAFGQLCVVLPDQDAVIAITAATQSIQGILDTVWEHLLPNMKDAPLPEDQVLVSNLADQLKNLSIDPPKLQQSSSLEDQINGITYTLEDNQFSLATISISFNNDEAEVTLITKLGEKNVIRVGRGQWLESFALILEPFMNRILSSFTWSAEDQLQLSLLFVEMPFLITLDINILENMLILKQRINVNMGPLEFDDIIGRIQ
ncbi:CubicO group peptidase (beta-lactamase class C family) [Paenibacillus sp. PastF-3]|uniref:serine hydrolase domain-containing protein n=1 Tax=Paenibacillus sp. PastF-3 TaxID=2940626 RepID=UPI0024767D42|nr:serine hydrolase [Paenibacillus sp. PastF-3]MDH6368341.1 CubicO group peptidase (beta-lactamase class C family) [Paenibacillus sp. PastF-3]